jgi:hypothetical protein
MIGLCQEKLREVMPSKSANHIMLDSESVLCSLDEGTSALIHLEPH